MTSETTQVGRRLGRLLSPAGFGVAGMLLLLPFVAVSCEAPGGFGRAAPGGTTTYRGVDLVLGNAPAVSPEHLLPAAVQRDDVLPAQPLAIAVAVLILTGLIATIALRRPSVRRAVAGLLAATAVVFVVANQATVRALLESRLREQLTVPMPEGRTATDFVQTQSGFWLCLTVLGLLTVGNALGWLSANRVAKPDGAAPQVAVATPLTDNVADPPPATD